MTLRSALVIVCTAATSSGCCVGYDAPRSPEQAIVERAAAALGGVERVRAVRAMTMAGGGDLFALGQNRTLDGGC